MNTQNTPVHIRLWHKDFWRMSVANLLLTMSIYLLLPVMPLWLMSLEHFSKMQTGISMGVFGLGLFALGGFCSFLVQHYRRNIVCMLAILLVVVCTGSIYYMQYIPSENIDFITVTVIRFIQGACYGLAQMILSSTLIIDTSESFQRTEANHSSSWFGRFALSLGPMTGIVILRFFDFGLALLVSCILSILALLLIKAISFPFRTPEDNVKLFSLDRFFLPQGIWLFINLLLITSIIGLIISAGETYLFYGMMMGGFFLALLAQRFAFVNAELKSEVISGLMIMLFALLMMLSSKMPIVSYVSPVFVGFGIGIIGSRFLLFFIKLSRHCQRGTSQSSFFLAWEFGISLGMFAGYSLLYGDKDMILYVAISILFVSFIMYNFFVHSWFLKHKNR